MIVGLLSLGVQKVYAIDIDSDWIKGLRKVLEKHNVLESSYELKQGDVLNVPYKDERFDFVSINGVLIHLNNMAEIIRGFSEGARVCRKKGYFYTSYGPCGGITQGVIVPALRRYYKENTEFREFVDNLNPGILHEVINKICADAKKYTGETFDSHQLKSLFGGEFCTFIQNYLQAPTWFSNECTPELIEELYRSQGFVDVTRINDFVKRNDIRKYVAPLHYDRDYPLSKLLYGKGYVEYIGRKG